MIYWFTGQPAHGKTTLAIKLYEFLLGHYDMRDIYHIDGDDIRELFSNVDYSINGRVNNINAAQKIAHYLHKQKKHVIVSVVSPYIDQREDFKKIIGSELIEFYVHTDKPTARDKNKAIAYVEPKENFIDINTTIDNIEKSFSIVLKTVLQRNQPLLNKIKNSII
jgi:adenylylsulfate kinase